MDVSVAQQYGATFLSNLDNFLAQNYAQLKCREIHDIYSKFWDDLKRFRGTATNFTGLSEFLVFRFLIHQLGGSFVRTAVTKDTAEFAKGDLRLRQGLSTGLRSRLRPDITVFKSGRLMAVIQIKLFLVNGQKTFQEEISNLQSLRSIGSNDFLALLVIFDDYGFPQSLHTVTIPQGFSWVLLKNNDNMLHRVLENSLKLSTLLV